MRTVSGWRGLSARWGQCLLLVLSLTGFSARAGVPSNEASDVSKEAPALRLGIGTITQMQREQAERRLKSRLEALLCKDATINEVNRDLCAKDKDASAKNRFALKDPPTISPTDMPLLPIGQAPEASPAAQELGLAKGNQKKPPEVSLPGPPGYPRYRLVSVFSFAGEQRAEVLVNRKKRVLLDETDRIFRYEVVRIRDDGVELRHLDRPGDVRFYPVGALLR